MSEQKTQKKIYVAITNIELLCKCKKLDDAIREYEVLLENGVFYWIKVYKNGSEDIIKVKKDGFFTDKEEAKKKSVSTINALTEQLKRLLQ